MHIVSYNYKEAEIGVWVKDWCYNVILITHGILLLGHVKYTL